MIVQFRRVRDFSRVLFRGPGSLQIEQGDSESLSVAAPGDVIESIKSSVTNGTLELGYQAGTIARLDIHQAQIEMKLVLRELNHLTVAGSGSVDIKDLDTDQFGCRLMGNGQIIIQHLTADHIRAQVEARGRIRVLGDVESQQAIVSGNSRYEAEELISDSADIRMSDQSIAEIHVTDSLTALVGGDSALGYVGYPEVMKQGAGTIVRRRKQQSKSNRGSEHG